MKYSVLMTVYKNDDPKFFEAAIESMLNQTLPTDNFVLVCDGKLEKGLNNVIKRFLDKLTVVRLKRNCGLGVALKHGLKYCQHDLVARMDSDDISLPDRCEKQVRAFESDKNLAILSGTIQEFSGDILLKKRSLPTEHEEIVTLSQKRNPFNHPAVMYRKSAVIAAGGYNEKYHNFEDYDLWVRMLKNGAKGRNLDDTILRMRVSDDMYRRRGGRDYAKNLLRFHNHLRKTGWISTKTFATCAVPHSVVCIMPNSMRKVVYKALRKN